MVCVESAFHWLELVAADDDDCDDEDDDDDRCVDDDTCYYSAFLVAEITSICFHSY